MTHAVEQVFCRDRTFEVVEVELLHLLGIVGHLLGLDEDGIGGLGRRGVRGVGSHGGGFWG